MTAKLLQWLGALGVLALVVFAAGALMLVKDRVRIVVQTDDVVAGPEPVALLRDDVGVLQRDLAELRAGLGGNFEHLGSALEERASARHEAVQAIARDLAALRQRLEAQVVATQAVGQRLEQLATRVPAAESAASVEPPESVAQPPELVVAATQAPPAVAEPPAPVAKAKGFLSFSIPTATFQFDREQAYQLVPELCRVGFDAKSTLHDFSGVTSKVAGRFTADFDDPQGNWHGEVTCAAATLVTGVDGRDENMREYLGVTEHPQIRFEIQRFVPAEGGIDVAGQKVRGEVSGQMHIRSVTRELRLPVTIEVDASRRVVINGQVPLKLSDYEVPVPSQLGVINMQDEVVVWIALRARVAVGDGK